MLDVTRVDPDAADMFATESDHVACITIVPSTDQSERWLYAFLHMPKDVRGMSHGDYMVWANKMRTLLGADGMVRIGRYNPDNIDGAASEFCHDREIAHYYVVNDPNDEPDVDGR
jgi:hypothetical protein